MTDHHPQVAATQPANREAATNSGRDIDVTATYARAHLHEVAQALGALTGEAHPLAPPAHTSTPDTYRDIIDAGPDAALYSTRDRSQAS